MYHGITYIICKITTTRYVSCLLGRLEVSLVLLRMTIITILHVRWRRQLFKRTHKVTRIRWSILLIFIINLRFMVRIIFTLQSGTLQFVMPLRFTIYTVSILRGVSNIVTTNDLSNILISGTRSHYIYLLNIHIQFT